VSATTVPDKLSAQSEAPQSPPASLPGSLIQVAGRALASMGVREPGAALLEPLAQTLFSLQAVASHPERTETDQAGDARQAPPRSD
jgi:hypothetical protein